MCDTHYRKRKRAKERELGIVRVSRIKCTVCGRPAISRGWCDAHYRRWKRHGDPLGGRTPVGELEKYLRDVVLPYEGDECLRWPFGHNGGYGVMTLDGRMQLVSRVVCQRINGAPPSPTHEAAHLCGNGHLGCCTPSHLVWKTTKENHADKLIHGTHIWGERHGGAKLTTTEVREIRALFGRISQQKIAERFGVNRATVYAIGHRKAWAWLE